MDNKRMVDSFLFLNKEHAAFIWKCKSDASPGPRIRSIGSDLLFHLRFTSAFTRVTQLYTLVLQLHTIPPSFLFLPFSFDIYSHVFRHSSVPPRKPFQPTSPLSKFTLSPSFRSKTMFPLFDHFSFSVRCTRLNRGFKHVVRARPRWKTVETAGDTGRNTDLRALSRRHGKG